MGPKLKPGVRLIAQEVRASKRLRPEGHNYNGNRGCRLLIKYYVPGNPCVNGCSHLIVTATFGAGI